MNFPSSGCMDAQKTTFPSTRNQELTVYASYILCLYSNTVTLDRYIRYTIHLLMALNKAS